MKRPAKKTMTNASLESTPAEDPLDGFPVGWNWKVPLADVEVAGVVVVGAWVVVVGSVVAGTVGGMVGGSVVEIGGGVVTEGGCVVGVSVVGTVGRDWLASPPPQGAPNG